MINSYNRLHFVTWYFKGGVWSLWMGTTSIPLNSDALNGHAVVSQTARPSHSHLLLKYTSMLSSLPTSTTAIVFFTVHTPKLSIDNNTSRTLLPISSLAPCPMFTSALSSNTSTGPTSLSASTQEFLHNLAPSYLWLPQPSCFHPHAQVSWFHHLICLFPSPGLNTRP